MILFLNFKQKVKRLFLDPELTVSVDSKEKYQVVLSPSLYWIKRVSLPLKYVHEVKKIAHTLFEEILPAGNYNYYVYKDKNEYFIFAYEDSKILSLLHEKGISLTQIQGISFAQFALNDLNENLRIDEERALCVEDDIVVLLPAVWFKDLKEVQNDTLKVSQQTITLEHFSHIIDKKTLYTIMVFLFLFILLLLGEYFYFFKQKEQLKSQKEQLFKHYKLKPTLMQNRAILSSYKKEDLKQQKLRKYINYFLKANMHTNEKIISIEYDGLKLSVELKGVKKSDLKRILSLFYKEKIPLIIKRKNKRSIVEVMI